MNKIALSKPLLITLYGFPGSGKSYVARQLADVLQVAHVSSDRIRSELFEQPHYDQQENNIVTHLMQYMTHEFLSAGISVVYDANALRSNQRYQLRELARRAKADYILIWIQMDAETAFARTQQRDRRTSDDKYAVTQTEESFKRQVAGMQNPNSSEEYLVISGKHAFNTQRNAVVNRLYQMGLINTNTVQSSVAKPGLVNLVPNTGRVDLSRRNIVIR